MEVAAWLSLTRDLSLTEKATGSGFVADLDFRTFEANVPFDVCGVRVMPFEVWHGKDYKCMVGIPEEQGTVLWG